MVEIEKELLECDLFNNLSQEVVSEILSSAVIRDYPKGSVLIEKGKVPPALFIIRKGKVGIYNEDVLLAQLEPFSIMGESFLAEALATATTIAMMDLTLIELNKETFYEISGKHRALIYNIFNINLQRLRNSNNAALQEARNRERQLEELVNLRTQELNDALEVLKQTNQELSVTRDHLIETQKFRQQFLANMSHEIRTPMNAIVGLTNLLLKTPVSEIQDKYLNVIKKSGANLLVIINDILDLAKIESGKMELESVPFPLINALQNIYTILNLKCDEKGIRMDLNLDSQLPEYVFGDETRFTQVIMNLAGNAIKFTEKGGVTISASVEKVMGEDYLIRFGVKDTGIGIPQDKIDKIFESFGQASSDTTRKFGGTGLGLTISKQLVELHGGLLNVDSSPDIGSEFYFTIPYRIAQSPESVSASDDTNSVSVKGKKVLLVEDNEFNQMVAVDTLLDLFPELSIETALNGKEAIEKLQSSDYSFIFMDVQMPEMDGYEATRQIRLLPDAHKRNIRICAMTANVTREEVDECFAAGMNDYLMKPFESDVLREKVLRNLQEK
ncbi:MAG: response regulator [Bacteroidetes bacterium]|nr:MAG: response regulator [Bacteroidota bacterium]REK08146.1 MAG: response regulator [Bacteroidota bacterium]REK32351.1 MAG: response regulator [Bacteroidota bacterium]REK49585.1 MAG: response regulator [Bacteroidota bacterium]